MTADSDDGAAPDARPVVLGLAHLLRGEGVEVSTAQVIACVRAAVLLAPTETADLYWAARTTLISHAADLPVLERVFEALLGAEQIGDGGVAAMLEREAVTLVEDRESSLEPSADDGGPAPADVGAVASDVETLRHRRFDRATVEELRAMRALMARIPLSTPTRRTRRHEPSRRGRQLDVGRSLRRAVRTDGDIVDRVWRRRRRRLRPLVLVLDVSGSMAGYSRALLQFAFAARRRGTVEVFCFGTRLTRVTEDLGHRHVDAALAAASARVVDWDGGTRIGASLARLNHVHGRAGRLRGAVVVVCSDGLERGDPDELAREAARLGRLAHRLVWVNPLSGDEHFRPVQRGMQAVLPAIDRLMAGHDLASLEDLADVLAGLR